MLEFIGSGLSRNPLKHCRCHFSQDCAKCRAGCLLQPLLRAQTCLALPVPVYFDLIGPRHGEIEEDILCGDRFID